MSSPKEGMSQKMSNLERRIIGCEIEKRDDEKPRIIGHAAVFNSVTDLGFFREKVAPGAFTKSIKEDDVRALYNHDSNYVLGRNTAGTLILAEDERGLKVEIYPPETQWAKDLLTSIERGDISQMSFGFTVDKESWERGDKNEPDLRTLEAVKLWDVSPVTFPAYPETDVAVRSHDKWINETVKVEPFKYKMMSRLMELKLKLKGGL